MDTRPSRVRLNLPYAPDYKEQSTRHPTTTTEANNQTQNQAVHKSQEGSKDVDSGIVPYLLAMEVVYHGIRRALSEQQGFLSESVVRLYISRATRDFPIADPELAMSFFDVKHIVDIFNHEKQIANEAELERLFNHDTSHQGLL